MATEKKQYIPLPELDQTDNTGRETKGQLELKTSKGYNGGVECRASVSHRGNGFTSHVLGFGSGGDFSARIEQNKTARATQKTIDTMHAATFTPDAIDSIMQRVKDWYAAHPVTL